MRKRGREANEGGRKELREGGRERRREGHREERKERVGEGHREEGRERGREGYREEEKERGTERERLRDQARLAGGRCVLSPSLPPALRQGSLSPIASGLRESLRLTASVPLLITLGGLRADVSVRQDKSGWHSHFGIKKVETLRFPPKKYIYTCFFYLSNHMQEIRLN